ncbi:hypothetical protein [Tranquillimonas rosea]|uniref:hypothetical protein n=1 Tax=Tranquillimonas rosea TaxID=641238 RepID=UPI003BAB0427
MQDVTELERRINAALDRIGSGVEAMAPPPAPEAPAADPEEVTRLQTELEGERQVTAQLEERVRALKDRQDARVTALEGDLETAQTRITALEAERAQLKKVNDELRGSNAALREANAAGLADASLVDSSAQAELEALRRVHESDRAELDEILAALQPILEETADG